MTDKKLHPALDTDALVGKAKLYIFKALARKEAGDLDEYQLWASLALELLGKSALAKIHPSLIVDPAHYQSLFAASCINFSTDIKTISAKTLYERLQHVIPAFDETVKKFCTQISLRRNAELHSGETPFRTMRLDAWEAHYWYAGHLILEYMEESLEDWLGATKAETPKAIVQHAKAAKRQAVEVRVEKAKEAFESRRKADRESLLRDAENRQAFHYKNLFTLLGDHEWECRCPACGGKAFLAGIKVGEKVLNTYGDEDAFWGQVETYYSAEQFHCPVCGLFLDGSDEVMYAKLGTEYSETDEREIKYEVEYGND
jgi:rubrerythrin